MPPGRLSWLSWIATPPMTFAMALTGVVALATAARAEPHRVVSLNLCTDQLLVRLAPEKVAALSWLARDPTISVVAKAAEKLPRVRASAEAVLALHPDLVLGGTFGAGPALAALRARGVAVKTVGFPATFAAIGDQVRDVAAALGVPARGDALIREMDATLASLPAPTGRRALMWQPRGYTAGPGTLSDAVLRAAGLADAGDGTRWGIERLLRDPPDLLVVPTRTNYPSLATDLIVHPATAAIPRAEIPPALLICAGPDTARATALLSR